MRPFPQRVGLDVRLTYYTAGGIAKYIRHLAAELPAIAPDTRHYHFYRRGHSVTYSDHARRVDCWTPAHHPAERLALAAEIAPYRLNLLHSPDFIPPQGGYHHSVITVHDLTFLLYPQFLTTASRRYYHHQIRWAVRRATAISADSAATKLDLVERLAVPPEKIAVVHLGLDAEFVPTAMVDAASDASRLDELALSPGYLLFVGTFEPRKNVGGLLRAYACLRLQLPDAPPLVLVGRAGWLFDETLAQIGALNLTAHVRRLEDLPATHLPAVYRAAGALVLPSHYEGFGFPVLEAMGCGTPVVIANRASLPEIAGDAAVTVEPGDPEALAAA
ncbi:MAG: glycosyltransferase family 4 protein, partial [Anaerolineales bacterium]|nr:glycosyltransferase family 4 protein [Anaerolineales bacterium]